MNARPAFPADPAHHCADAPAEAAAPRARALVERQLAVLERLAEAGVQVALACEREALARSADAPAPQTAPDPSDISAAPDAPAPSGARSLQGLAMAYARAARAVRMTVLLQSRLMRDLESAERLAAAHAPALAEARFEAARERKARVERIVRRVAQAQSAAPEVIEALAEDAAERLDDDDLYGDVLTHPMGEIVARICRDLNLDPDWSRLAREAWAEAEIAAAPPGSPFAGLGVEASPATRGFCLEPDSARSFPLDGGRAGLGVSSATLPAMAQEAAPHVLHPQAEARSPPSLPFPP